MSNQPTIDPASFVPRLRSRFYHVSTQLRIQLEMPDAAEAFARQQLYQVLASHLAISLAVELPDAYVDVTRDQFQSCGLGFEDALAAAKSNLRRFNDANRVSSGYELMSEGFYCPAGAVGSDCASQILWVDEIKSLPTDGDPVLFLPHAGIHWIAGSHQTDLLALLCGLTLQELESGPPQPITSIPFVLRGEQWRPWVPETGHPCHEHVRELHVWDKAMLYEAQGNLLRGVYEAQGRDVHVADYRRATQRSGSATRHLSVCVWTETVPSVLPKTDFVCLQRLLNRDALDRGDASAPEFGESVFVPWKELHPLAIPDDPLPTYPERYAVDAFPAGSQWDAAKRLADAVPIELQTQLRMARRPESATDSVDQDARSETFAGSTPQAASLNKIIGIGCAAVSAGVIVLTICIGLWIYRTTNKARQRTFQAGDFEQLFPAMSFDRPEESDFELGQLGVPQQDTSVPLGPLPTMPVLPAETLPDLQVPSLPFSEQGFAGMAIGSPIEDRAPPGGILVGMRLVKGRDWGGAIRSVQPIYQVGDFYVMGGVLGPGNGIDQIQYLARPGYVVGQIRAQVGIALNAIQLEFHPASDTLPPNAKPYTSTWFGSVGGTPFELIHRDNVGAGVTGIDVVLSGEISSIQATVGSDRLDP